MAILKISRSVKEGTRLLWMPVSDAVELMLFIMFLSAAMGVIFRQRFLYVVLAVIVLMAAYELYQRKKDRKELERKLDEAISERLESRNARHH